MPIKKLINEPIKIILLSVEKEILEKNDLESITRYSQTRDLGCLNFDNLQSIPTYLTVLPLLPSMTHLLPEYGNSTPSLVRELVRNHIIDSTEESLEFETVKDRRIMTRKSLDENFTEKEINELLEVIINGSRRDIIPFSSPVQFASIKRELQIQTTLKNLSTVK